MVIDKEEKDSLLDRLKAGRERIKAERDLAIGNIHTGSMGLTDAEKKVTKKAFSDRVKARKAKKFYQTHERVSSVGKMDPLGGLTVNKDSSAKLKHTDTRRAAKEYKGERARASKAAGDKRRGEESKRDTKDREAWKNGENSAGRAARHKKEADQKNNSKADGSLAKNKEISKVNKKSSKDASNTRLSAEEVEAVRELLENLGMR